MVVVDEVGRLEARGGGWASHIQALLTLDKPLFILIARLDCMLRICDLFRLCDPPVIYADSPHALDQLRDAVAQVFHLNFKKREK